MRFSTDEHDWPALATIHFRQELVVPLTVIAGGATVAAVGVVLVAKPEGAGLLTGALPLLGLAEAADELAADELTGPDEMTATELLTGALAPLELAAGGTLEVGAPGKLDPLIVEDVARAIALLTGTLTEDKAPVGKAIAVPHPPATQ